MMGVRFLLAGVMMLALRWVLNRRRIGMAPATQIARAAAIGCVMLAGGTGLLGYAELSVPSGICSLVIGCAPILFAVLNRLAGGPALTRYQIAGGVVGLIGLAILTWSGSSWGGGRIPVPGLVVLVAGMFCWVAASVASQYTVMPKDHYLSAAVQMLAAGAFLIVVGLARREFILSDIVRMPRPTLLAIIYLASVGSCLGFTAYSWLLQREPANRVSSYAFVNPVVAVFLGVVFAGEPLTPPIAAAIVMTLAGVSLSLFGARLSRASAGQPEA